MSHMSKRSSINRQGKTRGFIQHVVLINTWFIQHVIFELHVVVTWFSFYSQVLGAGANPADVIVTVNGSSQRSPLRHTSSTVVSNNSNGNNIQPENGQGKQSKRLFVVLWKNVL